MSNNRVKFRRDYREARKQEYPEVGEQLDAIWKWIEANPGKMPVEVSQVMEKLGTVKTKFPKPK